MNLYGSTKGTEFENMIDEIAKGEAMAAGMYFTLAHIAKEQGKDDMAQKFTKIATDEARHSGMYSYLNGKMSEDIISILPEFVKEEENAYPNLLGLSEKIREAGLSDAADMIKRAALDEKGHQKLLELILKNDADK
ncbi:MAG: ferritin family protein [Sarcina sp.]